MMLLLQTLERDPVPLDPSTLIAITLQRDETLKGREADRQEPPKQLRLEPIDTLARLGSVNRELDHRIQLSLRLAKRFFVRENHDVGAPRSTGCFVAHLHSPSPNAFVT
jgi:hypothetical protein